MGQLRPKRAGRLTGLTPGEVIEMSFKKTDVSTAVDMVIQGYITVNQSVFADEDHAGRNNVLHECLQQVVSQVGDWAENLEGTAADYVSTRDIFATLLRRGDPETIIKDFQHFAKNR